MMLLDWFFQVTGLGKMAVVKETSMLLVEPLLLAAIALTLYVVLGCKSTRSKVTLIGLEPQKLSKTVLIASLKLFDR